MKKIIVYYSFEGNTEMYAKALADSIDAEVLKLKTIKEHKSKGFTKFLWGGSMAVMNRKPKLEKYEFDPSKYDLIILASPVWAGSFAPPLKTFIEREDLLAKNIAFFYTHQGGKGKTEQHFQEALEENHIVSSFDLVTLKTKPEENKQKILIWGEKLKNFVK